MMYDRSIELNPNDAETYTNKGKFLNLFQGLALSDIGKFDEAIVMHDLAISINPKLAKAYAYKGREFNLNSQ